ncbi:MAG TPA: Pvc16 family protein [Chloroflexota bacterium]|nr:Pvc16 family protein [Chloroflexota bacterium]
MFADLDETIRQLLVASAPDPNQVDVTFDTPDREWSSHLTRPAINCFLYDVRENVELRKQTWETSHNGASNEARRRKPPLRIAATYQITAWARAREDEHNLLWRALATLARYAPLPREVLLGELADQPILPVPAAVAQAEHMPANFADLWQALDNRIRPSLTYVVTLALDPRQEVIIPAVLVPPRVDTEHLDRQGVAEALRVRGRVRDATDPTKVLPGTLVLLRETGQRALADEAGWFVIEQAPRGPITLVARLAGRPEVELAVSVPAASYDLLL